MDNIILDINDGPVTPDYDGRHRGWQARLVVYPTDRKVVLYAALGSGVPEPVWHGRACSVRIPAGAAGEAVRDLLSSEEAQQSLKAICDAYEGESWDGNNRVGSWKREDPEDRYSPPAHLPHLEKLDQLLSEVGCYQDAAQWLDGSRAWTKAQVKDAVQGRVGQEREAAIQGYVDALAGSAVRDGVFVLRDDLEKVVLDLLQEPEEQTRDSSLPPF